MDKRTEAVPQHACSDFAPPLEVEEARRREKEHQEAGKDNKGDKKWDKK